MELVMRKWLRMWQRDAKSPSSLAVSPAKPCQRKAEGASREISGQSAHGQKMKKAREALPAFKVTRQ